MTLPDRLIAALRRCCQSLPDPRRGDNTTYAMADFALGAFAAFFMQSPSFLAHQRRLETGHGRSNCQTLFGMRKIPGDGQVRAMLDPIEPSHLFPMFADVLAECRATGGLDAMRCLGGKLAIALDGTEFHCSDKIHCPNCSHRKRGRGGTEYFHTMLAAAIVAPGHNRAVPLEPEFIVPHDGHGKQDCESRAARRWLAAHGARYRDLDPIALGDDLFSRQPICEAVLAEGWHFLFVCKPDSHPAIEEFLAGAEPETHAVRTRRGKAWTEYRYRWLNTAPRRESDRGRLAVRRGPRRGRQDNLSQRLRHRYRRPARQRRRNGRRRPGAMENRKRDLQRFEDQGVQPRTQFRTRQAPSRLGARHAQSAGVRLPHRVRLGDRAWRAARRELVTRRGFFHSLLALTA